jgi:hypothetical protein
VPAINLPPTELKHYNLTQVNLADTINAATSGECRVVAAKAPPTANEAVELLNSAKSHVETDTNSSCQC